MRAKDQASASASGASGASYPGGGSDRGSGYAIRGSDGSPAVDHRKDEVKLVEGKPMWANSKRASAEDNARRSFERNGEAFGAKSIDQFVKKAHAFVDHPPAGAQSLTRANGDTLFYDTKANVFAVADKAGAPRTMFKPDDGQAYWDQQKTREGQREQASRRSRRSQDDAA